MACKAPYNVSGTLVLSVNMWENVIMITWIKKNNVAVMEHDKVLLLRTAVKVNVYQRTSKYEIAVWYWVKRFPPYSFSSCLFSTCFVPGPVIKKGRFPFFQEIWRLGGVGAPCELDIAPVLSRLSSRTLLHRFLYQSMSGKLFLVREWYPWKGLQQQQHKAVCFLEGKYLARLMYCPDAILCLKCIIDREVTTTSDFR